MTLEYNTLLHKRYRILETLGKGGMGAVYRATDESLGVQVAVKENLIEDQAGLQQFRREATILANLRQQNLPRVTDHFVIEGQGQYLVMDFIEGEDLKVRMNRLGKLQEKEVILMGVAICDALNYLHNLPTPVLHRDIKPGNIKITPNGQVYLVDFGLAKVIRGSQETTSGARGLTPGFSPPEQYGSAPTDARSDIYALGATLYAALTGEPPEDGLSVYINQTRLTMVRDRNPEISRQGALAIEKALEVQAGDRYQTAAEFKQALLEAVDTVTRELATGTVTVAPPPPESLAATLISAAQTMPSQEATLKAKPRKRIPWLAYLSIIILCGGIAAAAVIFGPRFVSGFFPGIGEAPFAPPTDTVPPTDTPLPETDEVAGIQDDTLAITPTSIPPDTPTPGPTPLGGGAQIAFVSNRTGTPQIWLKTLDGSEPIQITDLGGGACQPTWSPDGLQLVFISPCLKNQQSYDKTSLFKINADGSGLAPLPSSPLGDYDPDWSPFENKIVFTTIRDYNRPQIWILNLDTGDSDNISNNVTSDYQPAWSPDGEHIVFVSPRLGPTELWVMSPAGENLIEFSRSETKTDLDPVWSPDGELILFTQLKPSGTGRPRLYAAPWKGGGSERGYNEFQLSDDPAGMREADYSPDGYWIVFTSNPEGPNHDIYIMRSNGSDIRQITTDPSLDFDPAWRPDGNYP